MANWTAEGFVGQMFAAISKHIAPGGMPAPVLWGDPGVVRERLREGISELRVARRHYQFCYPFPPEDVVEFFRTHYGPMLSAFASLDADGQTGLRHELVALWSAHNTAGDGTTRVDGEYLEIIATRSSICKWPRERGLRKAEGASRRAALLADRSRKVRLPSPDSRQEFQPDPGANRSRRAIDVRSARSCIMSRPFILLKFNLRA
jgi:hypothetical protein